MPFALRWQRHFDYPKSLSRQAKVRPEDMDEHVRISADPEVHAKWLRADIAMGFDEIYIHNVGRNQREFIEVFGNMVLSSIRDTNRTQNQA